MTTTTQSSVSKYLSFGAEDLASLRLAVFEISASLFYDQFVRPRAGSESSENAKYLKSHKI
jgi:hypothetical protein